jgi:hypothetical protein
MEKIIDVLLGEIRQRIAECWEENPELTPEDKIEFYENLITRCSIDRNHSVKELVDRQNATE